MTMLWLIGGLVMAGYVLETYKEFIMKEGYAFCMCAMIVIIVVWPAVLGCEIAHRLKGKL